MEDSDEIDVLTGLSYEEYGRSHRVMCKTCKRPSSVCLCVYLPNTKIKLLRSNLYILQHPQEIKRRMNTVQILNLCINSSTYKVFRGRRFPQTKFKELYELNKDVTYVLYPSKDAQDLAKIDPDKKCNVIIIDGTWNQANELYKQNKVLHDFKTVKLKPQNISEYVIRQQPNAESLSTLECAAFVLSHTENNKSIEEILFKPLRGFCKYQLDKGAEVHDCKVQC